jgi:WD40 repeat protein/tRNA A-37 threonylcarbamoyl transferase component Bud32
MNQPKHSSQFLDARRIDQFCDQFEDEWSHDHRPSILEFLTQVPETEREELLRCLLPLELELRQAAGEQPHVSTYLEDLPAYWKTITGIWLASGLGSAASETSAVMSGGESTCDVSPRVSGSGGIAGHAVEIPEGSLRELSGGRYQIREILGQGAMGCVYLAEDTQLNRQVALKLPQTAALADPVALSRFYREAQAAAQLRHPGICPVYDLGESDGTHFISMAWIEGQTLDALLESGPEFRPRGIANLILKLLRALGEAHRHGVVHRDLKPANIMIDQSGEPVITDFGLAQLAGPQENGDVTREDAILGSPFYMSPEQAAARHNEIGPASDVYSLGVILFRLLTGRLPYEGNIVEVLSQKLTIAPPAPSELCEGVDPELESICLKMMAMRIEDRYASTEQVEADLVGFLERLDHPVSEVSSRPRSWGQAKLIRGVSLLRGIGRQTALAASTTVVLLLGVVLYFQTQFGVVRIEWLGEGATPTIRVDENEIEISDFGRPLKFHVGPRTLTAIIDGTELQAQRGFTVSRKGEALLKVKLVDGELKILTADEDRDRPLRGLLARPQALPDGSIYQLETVGPRAEVLNAAWHPTMPLVAVGTGVESDGRALALRYPGRIRLYRTDTKELVGVMTGHKGAVWSVAWNHAGDRLASVGDDGKLRIWNEQGTLQRVIECGPKGLYSVAWNTDGTRLVTGGFDHVVRFWNTPGSAGPVSVGHADCVTGVAWSPNGKLVASSSFDGTVRLWNASDGSRARLLTGHKSRVWSVAFSPDSLRLVSGSDDTTVRNWSVTTNDVQILTGHTEAVGSVAWSDNGKWIASGANDGTVRLWTVDGGEGPVYQSETDVVWTVEFAPGSDQFVSGGRDRSLRFWNVSGTGAGTISGMTNHIDTVDWSAKSDMIAAGCDDGSIRLLKADGKPDHRLNMQLGPVISVAWHPEGQWLASGGVYGASVIDGFAKNSQAVTLPHQDEVYDVAWNADGTKLVTACNDTQAYVFPWPTLNPQQPRPLPGHTSWVWSARFDPTGNRVVSGSGDASVRVHPAQGTASRFPVTQVRCVTWRGVRTERSSHLQVWTAQFASGTSPPER